MNKKQFEIKHNIKLISKKDSYIMRVLGKLLKLITPNFMEDFFTTIRLPFCKGMIAYPLTVEDPMEHMDVLEHELYHVEQQRTSWGLFKSALLVSVFPLPVLFSGRFFLEADPFLNDIRKGLRTVEEVVDLLWDSYGWPAPKWYMTKYFEKKLKEGKNERSVI